MALYIQNLGMQEVEYSSDNLNILFKETHF